jgi:hypothetical protein
MSKFDLVLILVASLCSLVLWWEPLALYVWPGLERRLLTGWRRLRGKYRPADVPRFAVTPGGICRDRNPECNL